MIAAAPATAGRAARSGGASRRAVWMECPQVIRPGRQMEGMMPKFLIEREIQGAGQLGPADLHGISVKSCGVITDMNRAGADIQWVQSYVTADKVYCVYNAPNEGAIRQHAERGGFPANRIERIQEIIDPTTAD
jgi:hypothetical protein